MVETLIRGAELVVTMDDEEIPGGWVAISETTLAGIGKLGRLRQGAPADVVVGAMEKMSFAGAHTDPVEACLRCEPIRARHTTVNGRAIGRRGSLQLSNLDDTLGPHRRISREWQLSLEGAA